MSYPPTVLAQDYPNNLDSILAVYSNNNQLEEATIYLDKVLKKVEQDYGNQSDTFAFYLGYQANIKYELGNFITMKLLFKTKS
jgi:hypothetical protein